MRGEVMSTTMISRSSTAEGLTGTLPADCDQVSEGCAGIHRREGRSRELVRAAGGPNRHEATTGTNPYFLSGYGYEDDGRGNYEKFAFPNSATGPQWGYATSRDDNIYLHIIKGPDGKKGFDAIAEKALTIRPVQGRVTSVTWLNEDVPVTSFRQDGDSLSIDLANVREDQIDTIIKIVTDNPARKYKLTDVVATGKQLAPGVLKVNAEGHMTYPALKARLSGVTYSSANPRVAAVRDAGIVTPVSDGTTGITVRGTHEGVTRADPLKVRVNGGDVSDAEDMIGASLLVEGKRGLRRVRSDRWTPVRDRRDVRQGRDHRFCTQHRSDGMAASSISPAVTSTSRSPSRR